MEIKKANIPNNTITRKLVDLDRQTGNIYESVVIISKRADQIASEVKQELTRKLADFSSVNDTLEETFGKSGADRNFEILRKTPQTDDCRYGRVFGREGLFPGSQTRDKRVG